MKTLKQILLKILPYSLIYHLKSLIKKEDFDEVNLVFKAFRFKKGGVMIDVGAHHGGSLMHFSKIGWQIFAFEPDPNNRKVLLSYFGHKDNVNIDVRAVSDVSGQVLSFYTSDVSTGISGLHKFHDSHKAVNKVETIRLSDFLAPKKFESIDFLKIDTEGHDLFVLKGFDWTGGINPGIVLCEFEDKKTIPLGYTVQDLISFLREKGYKIIISEWLPIIEYGIKHSWKKFYYDHEKVELGEEAWGNLIAYKAEYEEPLKNVFGKY